MKFGSMELDEHTAAWFAGWSAVRGYEGRTGPGYWAALRPDLNDGWEYVCADPTHEAFAALAAEVTVEANRSLCIVGPHIHDYVKWAHAAGMGMVSTSEHLMVCAMETQDNEDPFLVDPDLRLVVKQLGARSSASACQARFTGAILRGDSVLAHGSVGVNGEYAVFDRLETHPGHRRQGLGMMMMKSLTARALDYPVTTGLVLASTGGQRLYHKLGWRSLSPMTVLVPRERLAQLARL